ncbi:hypothetical protein JRG19_02470 [Pseudoclavibacter alba]|uniref:hypothetical protein n=1 Tax=Pseudoclavibacter albus TaxID=272241 RepID=UPI0019CFCFFF|nr:hypothetical protein [Pseudoclavibacter alba]MBN6777415.1 hypothetical protein [Pseudoclavibacter alba]
MPILNYSTTVAAEKTATEVQAILGRGGASRIQSDWQQGRIVGISFEVETEFGPRGFMMPVRTAGVLAALESDPKVPASKSTPEHAERVAWRIAKDWLEAQIALIDAGLATIDEVMMPYMLDNSGRTVFEGYRASQLAITDGGEQA